jgi:hypothetical protein
MTEPGAKAAAALPLRAESVFHIPDTIAWRTVEQDLIVLNVQSGEYYTFNDVAKSVWLCLSEGKPLATAVEQVVAEYEVTPATAEVDVRSFIETLLSDELIETPTQGR